MKEEKKWNRQSLPPILTQTMTPLRSLVVILWMKCRNDPLPPTHNFHHTRNSIELKQLDSGLKEPLIIAQESDSNEEELKREDRRIPNFPRIIRFFDGVSKTTQIIWPPAFLGMFAYDIYQYIQFPNNHYQMSSLRDLILGSPRNYHYQYASLSSNLGGDIPAIEHWNYWPWLLIVASALLGGVVQCSIGHKNFIKDESFNSLISDEVFQKRSFFQKLWAISLLSKILQFDRDSNYRKDSLDSLEIIAKSQINPIVYLHANYQLWSAGYSDKWFIHLLSYGFITPIRLFAVFRLWSLIFYKTRNWIKFNANENRCQSESKIWRYVPERGNYDCTVCDWDFVDYRRSLHGQGCLDALLSSPRQADEILSGLKILKNHGPFNALDFSRQDWPQWPLEKWREITQLLQVSDYNSALILNLSRPVMDEQAIFPSLLAAIAAYLEVSQVEVVDFSRLWIGLQGMAAILPGLNNNRTRCLNFTATWMDDEIAQQFLATISNMPQLQTLVLAENRLSGYSLHLLNDLLNYSLITELDIGGNFFNATDIEEFSKILSKTVLQKLDISGIDFTEVDMSEFGEGIRNATLSDLSMSNCQISDSQATELFSSVAYSAITRLNWAANQIGYKGLQTISDFLLDSQITNLILDDNRIDDDALSLLNKDIALTNNSLQQLSLSGNPFTSDGFMILADGLANSTLQTLKVARTLIGDTGIQALVNAVKGNKFLHELDVSNTGLTSKGAGDLFYFIADSNVTVLDVSGNAVIDAAGDALRIALNGSHLQRLYMSSTQITTPIFHQALLALPDSSLQVLDVGYNALDDTIGAELAQLLITPVTNSDYWLTHLDNNLDFNRALGRAVPVAVLNHLVLNYAEISAIGARALCLILPSSRIQNQDLVLTGNPFQSKQTGISGCSAITDDEFFISSASTLFSPNFWMILIIAVFMLLLLNSRRSTDLLKSITDMSSRVFPAFQPVRNVSFSGFGSRFFNQFSRLKKINGGISHEKELSLSSDCRNG